MFVQYIRYFVWVKNDIKFDYFSVVASFFSFLFFLKWLLHSLFVFLIFSFFLICVRIFVPFSLVYLRILNRGELAVGVIHFAHDSVMALHDMLLCTLSFFFLFVYFKMFRLIYFFSIKFDLFSAAYCWQ